MRYSRDGGKDQGGQCTTTCFLTDHFPIKLTYAAFSRIDESVLTMASCLIDIGERS